MARTGSAFLGFGVRDARLLLQTALRHDLRRCRAILGDVAGVTLTTPSTAWGQNPDHALSR